MKLFKAKYMFDGTKLLTDKTVAVKDNIVVDADSQNTMKKVYNNYEIEDLGYGVLLPGFVNLHTHLELSYLKNRLPQGKGFVKWLESIILNKHKIEDKTLIQNSMQKGLDELYESGVRIVADISNTLESYNLIKDVMPHSVIFYENYSLLKNKACAVKQELESSMSGIEKKFNKLRIALAIHSIYSTHPCLISYIANYKKQSPLSIHLLESRYENEFLRSSGELFEFLKQAGLIEQNFSYKSAFDYLEKIKALRKNTIFVHMVHSEKEDFDKIKNLNSTIAVCPRSNKYISNELPNLYLMEESGVNIGIGTDSLASNWDLNFLNELKFIHKNFSQIKSETIFKWATSNGAKALSINLGFNKNQIAYPFFMHTESNKPLDEILEKKDEI